MRKYYLAIDLGASSGRHIVGWVENGSIQTAEVYRFSNSITRLDDHLTWDIDRILFHIKEGIRIAKDKFGQIESLSIDTWGVDYVLLRGDEEIRPCYAYRDSRTEDVIPQVHQIIPFSKLYQHTGIQFMPYNTIYQLYSDKLSGRLEDATDFLMLPSYFLYKLCGVKAHEYTMCTTTGLIDAKGGVYDRSLIRDLGLPASLFPDPVPPGTVLGTYEGIRVVLCATHDTASAVEGIPMDGNVPYISSGTWSLLGLKTKTPITTEDSECSGWSNEGGVGYIRYQKSLLGMWLVNCLQAELCPDMPIEEVVEAAKSSSFREIIDISDTAFFAPESMKAAFDFALGHPLSCPADYFSCAYRSLAAGYAKAVQELERNTGMQFSRLYIVGGGAKNDFLNQLTGAATGKQIISLPIESSALGNIMLQLRARPLR